MKLIAIYKPFEAIKAVYCLTCFVVLKITDKLVGYKTVETEPVPNMNYCRNCIDNKGPKGYDKE